jgi:hypothetical protein
MLVTPCFEKSISPHDQLGYTDFPQSSNKEIYQKVVGGAVFWESSSHLLIAIRA